MLDMDSIQQKFIPSELLMSLLCLLLLKMTNILLGWIYSLFHYESVAVNLAFDFKCL